MHNSSKVLPAQGGAQIPDTEPKGLLLRLRRSVRLLLVIALALVISHGRLLQQRREHLQVLGKMLLDNYIPLQNLGRFRAQCPQFFRRKQSDLKLLVQLPRNRARVHATDSVRVHRAVVGHPIPHLDEKVLVRLKFWGWGSDSKYSHNFSILRLPQVANPPIL